jgi:uncharacterized membrane protein
VRPYKATILNIFTLFDEFCLCIATSLCFFFEDINIESDEEYTATRFDVYVGWMIIGSIAIFIIVNLLYLIPVKVMEIYNIFKKIYQCMRGKKDTNKKESLKKSAVSHLVSAVYSMILTN